MTHTKIIGDFVHFQTPEIPEPELTESGSIKVGPWTWKESDLPNFAYLERQLEFLGAIEKAQAFVADQRLAREEAEKQAKADARVEEAAKIMFESHNCLYRWPSNYYADDWRNTARAILKAIDEGLV